jgi:hypothetical protein
MDVGRFFFRAIEDEAGRWACRRGRQELDRHAELTQAIEHLTAVAGQHRPSEVLVHHVDGRVLSVAVLD